VAIRYNVGSLGFDWDNNLIEVQSPQNTLSIQDLINAIREAEASEIGMNYDIIATASGKEMLDSGVYVGITVNLVNWQIKFWSGNYIAKIAGGNLVGGLGGDPVAYSAGVQVLLVQSAASTVVVTSDGLNAEQAALLSTAATESTKARQMQTNSAEVAEDGSQSIIYDDDGVTPLVTFDHPTNKKRVKI